MGHEILDDLMPKECHWQAPAPSVLGTFLGHQLLLTISTDWSADRTRPLPASSSELSLAEVVLGELPAILEQAEAQFFSYEKDTTSPERVVRHPRIWIDREGGELDGLLRWALVVHHAERPDYGWHIEFDRARCIQIWAGT